MSEKPESSGKADAEDTGVSMVDILEEEERLEADANAVLGDSDDKNCTYPTGYVKRQALYSCSTCKAAGAEPSGVCLACSYECHEGHDLIELYTKRFFRCDCGNSRFPNQKCKLYPDKKSVNPSNKYNHNFSGLYCICSRPYPDPDDEVDDEMIQCVICEDWYHGRHLGTTVPDNQDYGEVVCTDCMKRHDFLWAYTLTSQATMMKKEESNTEVDVLASDSSDQASYSMSAGTSSLEASASNVSLGNLSGNSDDPDWSSNDPRFAAITKKYPARSEGASGSERSQPSVDTCLLKDLKSRKYDVREHAIFLPGGWRQKLCQCVECMTMYKDKEILFLTDDHDTVQSYEERGRQNHVLVSQHDKEVNALSQMNRIQQVELLQGFNDMKSQLSDYLKKFAENGKVVREEDIKEFFSNMQARKRQKTEEGFQYNCK
ncbi:putative E3 ubiquitin-protein ligase UBR7 [Haliotis rubra]|uniref:putative E3 ubiquitin-protein ligase UBR7 n=1 Tax=Haliotis rubra TaxID=36100 RepID=UPI001EE5785F|nr:putative E3 ubiquitin-protein ligase UBR7 [Haliotis rubra]XP_046545116.1 putative E3 ubiquitin-protein ligase UBR7 [Haliotis rubra]